MILIDTSVWVDFFNRRNQRLNSIVEAGTALAHPMVVGEIGMGSFASASQREEVITALASLTEAPLMADDEFHRFVSEVRLFGTGVGYVDAHLLGSARLAGGGIWTQDRRLEREARRMDLLFEP